MMLTPVWKRATVLFALDFLASNFDTLGTHLVALGTLTTAIALALA
jgi:hypothetical protein